MKMHCTGRNLCLFLLMVLVLEMPTGSCRNMHVGSRPELRSRRLEKERTRLLLRLLETSYSARGFRSKIHVPSEWDTLDDDDEPSLSRSPPRKIKNGFRRKHKPQTSNHKSNGRKRFGIEDVSDTNSTKSCCPQRYEIIEPNFGRNRSGHMVELYKDEKIQQQFYELVCEPEFANEPCKFLEGNNKKISRCSQQHAFTYALVRSNQSLSGWSLDHIRIRSGCVCKLYPHQRHHSLQMMNSKEELKRSQKFNFNV